MPAILLKWPLPNDVRERHRDNPQVLRERYWDRPTINLEEFADLACMSVRQLYRLRARRDASFPTEMRPGGSPIFKRIEVEDWLESRAIHRKTVWIHPEWKAPQTR